MIGGGLVGCETALYLAQLGKKVTIIEILDSIARDMFAANRMHLLKLLTEANVNILTETKALEITDTGITISDKLDNNYFVVDFMKLTTKLKEIIEPMDHYVLIPTEAEDIKLNKSQDSVEVTTPTKRYVFPLEDVCFLPLPATTSELLARYIHDKLKELYKGKKIVVKVGESKSSMASYEE